MVFHDYLFSIDPTIESVSTIVFSDNNSEESFDIKEKNIPILAKLYAESGSFNEIINMLNKLKDLFTIFPKSKTAKLGKVNKLFQCV